MKQKFPMNISLWKKVGKERGYFDYWIDSLINIPVIGNILIQVQNEEISCERAVELIREEIKK